MKINNILLIILVNLILLNAQVFQVEKKWNLFGTTQNIDNLDSFKNECVSSIHTYNNNKKEWDNYPDGKLNTIKKGVGFYLYANKNCIIHTDKIESEFNVQSYFLSNCSICHGNKGQGFKFKAIRGNSKFWYLSRLAPFKEGSRTSPSAMSRLLKNLSDSNLNKLTEFLSTL